MRTRISALAFAVSAFSSLAFAGEGEAPKRCGPIANGTCPAGYTCNLKQKPGVMGGTGICVKDAAPAKKRCGPIAHGTCPNGYYCNMSNVAPGAVGGTGTCESILTKRCGPILNGTCPTGYTCNLKQKPGVMGGTGTCVKAEGKTRKAD
jgi:hypothetical protein